MASSPGSRSASTPIPAPPSEAPRRRSQVNLSDQAYEQIEGLLVSCELKPGRVLATHELQDAS